MSSHRENSKRQGRLRPAPNQRRIVSYDPGGTTGYAVFSRDPSNDEFWLMSFGEFETWTMLPHQIPFVEEVVFEEVRSLSPGFNTIGIEVMGAIKVLCQENKKPWRAQQPGMIRGFQKWKEPELLKISSKHARDAVCHGLMYIGIENVRHDLFAHA